MNNSKAGLFVCLAAVGIILASVIPAQATDPMEYGYWDDALHNRALDHVSFLFANLSKISDVHEVERVLQTGRKVVIYAPVDPGKSLGNVVNSLHEVKLLMDQIQGLTPDDILYVQIAQDTIINNPAPISYWESLITQARNVFGPQIKLCMDFSDSYYGPLPAGLDVYAYEFYSSPAGNTGWEISQSQVDLHADSKFNPFRNEILNANGTAKDIMVTARGYSPVSYDPLNSNYPGFLVDWVERQSDVIGIAWWAYATVPADAGSDPIGIIDMPAFAASARAEGLAMGYGFTPPRNLLDNPDFELGRYPFGTVGNNYLVNGNFETPGPYEPNYPFWWDKPVNQPWPDYITDGSNAYEGTDSLFWSWTQGGSMMNSPSVPIQIFGGADYRFSTQFLRDAADTGSEAPMQLRVKWFGRGSLGEDAVFVGHSTYGWQQEVLEVQAPFEAEWAQLVLTQGAFGTGIDSIGYWDDVRAEILTPDRYYLSGTPTLQTVFFDDFDSYDFSAPPAVLQTVLSDDFSGDLSNWNLDYIKPASNSVYINAQQQLVLDAGSLSNHRGFLLTNLVLPSTSKIGAHPGLAANQAGLTVSFDVISTTSEHAGGFLFGAVVDPCTGSAGNTKMYDAFCGDLDGHNALMDWNGYSYYSDAGPGILVSSDGWDNGNTNASNVGHRVTLEWRKNSSGDPVLDHGVIYIDGVEQPGSFMLQPGQQAGALGFYMLLNRDVVIDNFEVKMVEPYQNPLTQNWNLDYIEDAYNSVYVNGSKQLVLDAGAASGNHRGFLLTKLELLSTEALAIGLNPDDVGMSVSFDVISTTSEHAGALLFGATVDPDTKSATGTKMYDGFCGQLDGAGSLYQWPAGITYNSDAGPGLVDSTGWSNGTAATNEGHTVKLEWLKNSSGLNQLDHGVIYIDGVAQPSSFMDSPDAQAGSIGFWMLLDRDMVIDNFEVKAVQGATLVDAGGPLTAADGNYPENWRRTGSSPAYAAAVGQARLGQDCVRAAWIPETGYSDMNAYTTDPLVQGPIFTDAAAQGSAIDYTLSAYWKTADEDDDGIAEVQLRIKTIDDAVPGNMVSDTSQTYAINTGGWQRLTHTATIPAGAQYAYVYLSAVESTGVTDSIGYFDSVQFEQGSSATAYMFLPLSTLQSDYNINGKVSMEDLANLATDWLVPFDLEDFAVMAQEWQLQEWWYE